MHTRGVRYQRSRSEGRIPVGGSLEPSSEAEGENNNSYPTSYFGDDGCCGGGGRGGGGGTETTPELGFKAAAATAATTSSPEFVRQLLRVLFAGMTPPDTMLVNALTNDPPYGFFSRLPNASNGTANSAIVLDPLGLGLDLPSTAINANRRTRRISSAVMRLFSPIRKKSRHKRSNAPLRPSTTSLPTQMIDNQRSLGEHWWSMVQLAPAPAVSRHQHHHHHQPERKISVPATAQPPPLTSARPLTGVVEKRRVTSSSSIATPAADGRQLDSTAVVEEKEKTPEISMDAGERDVSPKAGPSSASAPSSPTSTAKGKEQLQLLKRDVLRYEAAIQKIQKRRSELSDWFLEQMSSAAAGGGGGSDDASAIKRKYKRNNAELKQRRDDLESRLSVARLNLTRLEESLAAAAAASTVKQDREGARERNPSTSSQKQQRGDDTDVSVSLATVTPSTFAVEVGEEETPPSPSLQPQSKERSTAGTSQGGDQSHPVAPTDPAVAVDTSDSTAVHQHYSYGGEPATVDNFGCEVVKALGFTSPPQFSTTSSDPAQQQTGQPVATSPSKYQQQQRPPSSAKKHKKGFKHTLELFGRPFGRRSDLPQSPVGSNLKKAISDEQLATTNVLSSPNEAATLSKVSSAVNTRTLSPTTCGHSTSKVKSGRHGNGAASDCPTLQDTGARKSASNSISSRPRFSANTATGGGVGVDSAATSGSDRSGALASSSPGGVAVPGGMTHPFHTGHATSSRTPAAGGTIVGFQPHSNVRDILDLLYGGVLPQPPPLRYQAGGMNSTHSGAASTHSGGGGGGEGLNGANGSAGGGGAMGPGGAAAAAAPPPAYNVAVAFVMLHQRIQALVEAHADAQTKMLAELREDFGAMRAELTETRSMVNSLTVDVEALRRDMQTKEEVAAQKLVNTISRLEQLDASAEKLRQDVQQDLMGLRNEQKHALEPLKYQLATETRDLRDMFTTLNNKVTILEKCERLSNLDRDQPQMLRSIANTLTNLVISLVALMTTLVQFLIRFLNAGATVTNNRVSAIVLNVCILVFFLVLFLAEPVYHWWNRTDTLQHMSQPSSALPPR